MEKLELKHYLVLFLLLLISFYTTYSLHLNYPFPYHHDEWQHLAISTQINEQGYNTPVNPYLDEPRDHVDLEPGFHLFLASFFTLTKLDPILTYKYLAAVFSVISALAIFLCCYKLSKNYFVGLISVIVFISLKTNVNILGKNYFIPLTMVIPFMFLYILFLVESLRDHNIKKLSISVILLTLIFLIHPPSFVILLFPSFFELILNKEFLLKNKRFVKYSLILAVFIVIFFSSVLIWKGSTIETKKYLLELILFEPGWGKLEITFFLPLLFGLVNTFFAFITLIITFIEIFNSRKIKYRTFGFFMLLAFFSLGTTAMFNKLGFTIFVPYSRVIHYSMIAMLPLTAIGVSESLNFLCNKLRIKNNFTYKLISSFVFLLIIINSKYALDLTYKQYQFSVVTEEGYGALKSLNSIEGSNKTIITPYFMTSAVYPVAKIKVAALVPAQMQGGFIQENLDFYITNCTEKLNLIEKSNSTHILSPVPIDCEFLRKVDFENYYIYAYRKDYNNG